MANNAAHLDFCLSHMVVAIKDYVSHGNPISAFGNIPQEINEIQRKFKLEVSNFDENPMTYPFNTIEYNNVNDLNDLDYVQHINTETDNHNNQTIQDQLANLETDFKHNMPHDFSNEEMNELQVNEDSIQF